MPTVAEVMADGPTFDRHADVAKALLAAGVTDVQRDLYDYGGGGLLQNPMKQGTLNGLLKKLHTHENTLEAEDPDCEATIVQLMRHVRSKVAPIDAAENGAAAPAANAAEKERVAAEKIATDRYSDLYATLYRRVRAGNKIDSKLIKRGMEELKRGTLSPECTKLGNLKSALAATVERRTQITEDMAMSTTESAAVVLAKNADVLLKIVEFGDYLLCIGFCPLAPTASNPLAGSVGAMGVIKTPDPADTAKTVDTRVYVTPDFVRQYLLAAVAGTAILPAPEMVAAHNYFWSMVADYLQADYNIESAGFDILSRHSFATLAAAAGVTRGVIPADLSGMETLKADNERLRKELAAAGHKRKTATFGFALDEQQEALCRAGGLCCAFQRGACKNKECKYKHVCMLCGGSPPECNGAKTCTA